MSFEEMRNARLSAYANAIGISQGSHNDGMPAYSTAGTLRKTMDQMKDQEYMISVEIGGKDEYDETVYAGSCGNPYGEGAAALQQ